MNKMEAYKFCQSHGAAFIANVVLCQHSNPARKLKAIARLLETGHAVSLAQFSIDCLLIDGVERRWSELDGMLNWRDRINDLRKMNGE
jgi:hypothetical protein